MKSPEQIEWTIATPSVLPSTSYWPFFMAVGMLFLGWGLLTSWIFSLAGLIVLMISLAGWINLMRHERRNKK